MIGIGDFARLGRVSGRMLRHYDAIGLQLLDKVGVVPAGPSIAYYDPAPEQSEDAVSMHATFPVAAESVPGLQTFVIPAAQVATVIHRGSMDGIDAAYQTVQRWIRDRGFTATGDALEIYLEVPDDVNDWVTEVQVDYTR